MTRKQWPSDVYVSSWKEFRRNSNENKVTATTIMNSSFWPNDKPSLTMLDLGCGDALLAKQFLLEGGRSIEKMLLVDPDVELLNDSKALFGDSDREYCNFIFKQHRLSDDSVVELMHHCDVVIIAHVLYLIEELSNLTILLEKAPQGLPIFIVLDRADSIFTTLWKETAPTFHARVLKSHKILQGLSKKVFSVQTQDISSTLENPFLKHAGPRDAILSHLTYSNYTEATVEEREFVENTVSSRLNADGVVCTSTCYEIIRI